MVYWAGGESLNWLYFWVWIPPQIEFGMKDLVEPEVKGKLTKEMSDSKLAAWRDANIVAGDRDGVMC